MSVVTQNPPYTTAENADDDDSFRQLCRKVQIEKGAKPSDSKPTAKSGYWQTIDKLNAKNNPTQESDSDGTQDIQDIQRYKESQEIHRNTSRQASPDGPDDGCAGEEDSEAGRLLSYWAQFVSEPFNVYMQKIVKEFWSHSRGTEFEHAGAWKSELFDFVRLLKAHPDMQGKTAKAAFKEIDGIFRRSPGGHYAGIGIDANDSWMRWLCIDGTEAQIEFLYCWTKIRFLPGQSPLNQAFDRAKSGRVYLSEKTRENRPCDDNRSSMKDYEFFISLAGWLQIIMGDKPILLPCREVSELLHISMISISRYRHMAVEDNFLTITKTHDYRSKGKSEATEFRFDVGRCDMLKAKSQTGTVESFAEVARA